MKLRFRQLFICAALLSGRVTATTCQEQIVAGLRAAESHAALAETIRVSPEQLRYFLETPELDERVQALLVARLLIDTRGEELIAELYWRANATTRYAREASSVLRFREWITGMRFWTPFYRDRELLFADSVTTIGESLPSPLLTSFNQACARVEEPGFLKGLGALRKPLKDEIVEVAKRSYPVLAGELTRLAESRKGRIELETFRYTDPKRGVPQKEAYLASVLDSAVFAIIDGLNYIPADSNEFAAAIEARLGDEWYAYPRLSATIRELLLNFHSDAAPASYADFREWMYDRFERLIDLERRKLLKQWEQRPGRALPKDDALATTAKDPSTRAVEESSLRRVEEAPSELDSDEFRLVELELFAEETDSTAAERSNETVVPVVPRQDRTVSRRRNWSPREQPTSQRAQSPSVEVQKRTGFRVILSEPARRDKASLDRNPRLAAQIRKALELLESNPMHPGLASHLYGGTPTRGGGLKIFRSYVNNRGGGHRLHWHYLPDGQTIEIVWIGSHDDQ